MIKVPETGRFDDLLAIVSSSDQDHSHDDHEAIEILYGYPPRRLDEALNDDGLLRDVLRNNDVLVVQRRELAGVQLQGKGKMRISRKRNLTTESQSQSSKKKSSQDGSGRAIATLATIASTGSRSTQQRKSSRNLLKGKQSIEQSLVGAVSGESGKLNELLRDDFRLAVQQRYSEAQALARVNSAFSGMYTITPIELSQSSSSSSRARSSSSYKATITYSRGPGYRSEVSEVVEIFPETVCKEILSTALADEQGFGREILKPRNLANRSPRVFWSLVAARGGDITSTIEGMFPEIKEWQWIDERQRNLSAKALENLRQKEELEQRKGKKAKAAGKESSSSDHLNPIESFSKSRTEGSSMNLENSPGSAMIEQKRDVVDEFLDGIVNGLSISGLVPEKYIPLLDRVLNSDRSIELASISNHDTFRGRLIAANASDSSLLQLIPSSDQLEVWTETAKQQILTELWIVAVCGRNEWFRRLLHVCGIYDLSSFVRRMGRSDSPYPDIKDWVQELLGTMTHACPDFPSFIVNDMSGIELLQFCCNIVRKIYQRFELWDFHDEEMDPGDETEFYLGETGLNPRTELESLTTDGWIIETQSNDDSARLGEEVAIWTDEEKQFLMTAAIVAYLPPNESEPEALWKVSVKVPKYSNESNDSTDYLWLEDIDQEELNEALQNVRYISNSRERANKP